MIVSIGNYRRVKTIMHHLPRTHPVPHAQQLSNVVARLNFSDVTPLSAVLRASKISSSFDHPRAFPHITERVRSLLSGESIFEEPQSFENAVSLFSLLGEKPKISELLQLSHLKNPPHEVISADRVGDVAIIDPGYSVRNVGHHENSCRFFINMAKSSGLKPTVFGAFADIGDPRVDLEFCVPFFRWAPYRFFDHSHLDELENCQNYTWLFSQELQWLNDEYDLKAMAVHSATTKMICGITQFLRERSDTRPVNLIIGVLRLDTLKEDGTCSATEEAIYNDFFEAVNDTSLNARVILYSETKQFSDCLKRISNGRLEINTYPYLWSFEFAKEVASNREAITKSGKTLTLSAMGSTRREKGTHLIPAVVNASRHLNKKIDWRIQLDTAKVQKWIGNKEWARQESFQNEPNVTMLPNPLSSEQYLKEFVEVDVLLLPYGAGYSAAGSGVFFEAIAAGVPVIVPENSSMAEDLREWNVDFVSFSDHSPESIQGAIEKAIDRFEALTASSKSSAADWHAQNQSYATLSKWLRALS